MQHPLPTFFSEMAIYGTIIAVGGCGFLAYVRVLYATNFDTRKSLLGFWLLFMLLCEFIFWITKRHALTDEKRNVRRNNRKQLYWLYAWIFLAYFRIWPLMIVLAASLIYKTVRDRKFIQVPG